MRWVGILHCASCGASLGSKGSLSRRTSLVRGASMSRRTRVSRGMYLSSRSVLERGRMVGDRGIHQNGTSSYKEEHHRYHEYDDVCGEARTVFAFGFGLMTVSGHLVPFPCANLLRARSHNLTVFCSAVYHII